jgi:hypothetical protein
MITKYINKSLLLASFFFLANCTPDSVDGDGNGISQGTLDASFKVTKTSENHYLLKRNYNNYINSSWNIDDDGYNNGKGEQNLFPSGCRNLCDSASGGRYWWSCRRYSQ